MKSLDEMTRQEQDDVLKLANQIRVEREKDSMFQSLSDAKTVMIRWDVPYTKYNHSYFSVSVTADEVEELVKTKIFGDVDANK